MKNIIKMLLPAVLVAVGLVYASYLGDLEIKGLQAQLNVIANHEHVHEHPHEHNTDHEHDLFHEHDIAHDHGTHEHPEIRAMLELMFELENKVNAK
mgnify:CR=1 FL=1|jgi:hypothetical protein